MRKPFAVWMAVLYLSRRFMLQCLQAEAMQSACLLHRSRTGGEYAYASHGWAGPVTNCGERGTVGCAVLRPQQSPVREVRLQDHEDGPFRHLLLPRGRRRSAGGGAHGRALVFTADPVAATRPQR